MLGNGLTDIAATILAIFPIGRVNTINTTCNHTDFACLAMAASAPLKGMENQPCDNPMNFFIQPYPNGIPGGLWRYPFYWQLLPGPTPPAEPGPE